MADLAKLKAEILADGIILDEDVDIICRELYSDTPFSREQVEFLMGLRHEALAVCVSFEELVFEAVKSYVLTDGCIDSAKAGWLRQMLFADGTIDERERRFLQDLRNEAQHVSSDFEKLFDECMTGSAAVGD